MKLIFPIAIRLYDGILATVQTLGDLELSAAAADIDTAREKLRWACREALERTHPRLLGRMGHAPAAEVRQMDLPALVRRTGQWRAGAGSPHYLSRPTYVLERRFGGVVELSVEGLVGPVWLADSADASAKQLASRPDYQNILGELLRRHEHSLSMHQAMPDTYDVDLLEVEFEPLDLSRMPVDSLWLEAFAEVEAEDERIDAAPTLKKIASDWSELDAQARAERGILPAFGRDDIVEQLDELLGSSRPAAVVLVGPSRVGKTSIIKHLALLSAHEIQRGSASDIDSLESASSDTARRMWFADAPRLTSTDPMSGGWQEQCAQAISELEEQDYVLYLGSLIQALDAGKFVGSDYNLAQFLKPHLSDRRLRIVAEATVEEWNRIEQRDVGFARAFHVLRLGDPPEAAARAIVGRAAQRLSASEGIALEPAAVERAWRLQKRFATEGSALGGAIDFIGRTLRRAAQSFSSRVREVDLVERFCEESGLPPVMLLDGRSLDLEEVRQRLARRVMGQQEAVRQVADVVGITKAGLSSAQRPLGSFFFVGPTGVGKTELARALAQFLFGTEERLIRLDMSEYAQSDAYARLMGEGSHEGDLTAPVRRQPFSVILLDEIEKAHPSVYDVLLQVLGEARLSDAKGRRTRFQNTIVIMTSNLGVDTMRPAIGFGGGGSAATWEQHFRREAERYFRPEFLARIDQFIPFRSLSREVVEAISRRELDKLKQREGLRAREVEVGFSDDVVRWVAAAGWDAQYGARPIKRVVEQQIAWPMARRLAEAGELDAELSYQMRVGVQGDAQSGELSWDFDPLKPGGDSRAEMLAQIEKIAGLRRRLERCIYAEVFAELAWRVEDFDKISQTQGFWDLPDAADTARAAERARDLVEGVLELSGELEAIEELVREAYHTRSFELSADIDERVAEIDPRLHEVFLELLRSLHDAPDEVVLFLPATDPKDPWREQLVQWYRQLVAARGWKMKMRRAVPRVERPVEGEVPRDQRREKLWQHARKPSGSVLALEFEGRAARALLSGEDGLHRRISEEGNATQEVYLLGEDLDWPPPMELEGERPQRPEARSWNFRTDEVSMRGISGLELDEKNPWRVLWGRIEDLAWEMAGADWW